MRRVSKEAALAMIGDAPATACRMCDLVRAAEAIAATDQAVAVLDPYASRPGHVLVVLRRHEERITALVWDEYAALQRLAYEMCHAVERVLAPRRIYVAALGSADPLPTSFPHVHLHVVPLTDGGDADRPASVFTWANGMYVFDGPDEERALCERLRAARDVH
jgi:diadenosine tetraphosphate (Ap4A) HIT family hydrolase